MPKNRIVSTHIWLIFLFLVGCSCQSSGQLSYLSYGGVQAEWGNSLWLSSGDGREREMVKPWISEGWITYMWLPDGEHFYIWMMGESSELPHHHNLASLSGDQLVCVTCGLETTALPIPSPMGDKFVISSRDSSGSSILVANYDGTELHQIFRKENMEILGSPSWSPDGRYIVFPAAIYPVGKVDIFRIAQDGGEVLNITASLEGYDFFAPQWSPKGDQLAFYAYDRDNGSNSYVSIINIDGSGYTILVSYDLFVLSEVFDPTGAQPPQWSPDGRRLAFTNRNETGDFDIFLVNPDGSGLTNLTKEPRGNDFNPAWSPDGRQIAFESKRDGNWEIYVMNADGSDPVNISNSPGTDEHNPQWRPVPKGEADIWSWVLGGAVVVLAILGVGLWRIAVRKSRRAKV